MFFGYERLCLGLFNLIRCKVTNFCLIGVNKNDNLFLYVLLATESDYFVVGKTKIHYFCHIIN